VRRRLGESFGWLWAAYAISTYGTWVAFGAFPLIAIRQLHAPAFAVSLLEAAGTAVAALVAFPLGPWVERRAKRPVMIAMDLVRFVAMLSVPITYALGRLAYVQLIVVAVISGTAGITFTAASGAYLKRLVARDHLLDASGRFEATSWAATAVGPPVGGALIGLLGPVVTVLADAVSYLLSAAGVLRIRGSESPVQPRPGHGSVRLLTGWRVIAGDPVLRRLWLNSVLVGGLIMAAHPVLAVLLLGADHFAPWQYGLAFGIPALGGLAGARLSGRLVARYGRHRVLLASGWLRSFVPIGLVLVRPGLPGLLTVIAVEGLLITAMGVFNPIYAAERLERVPLERAAQMLATWTAGSRLVQAALMVSWGVLATVTSPLTAIAVSGVLLCATPLLLPRRAHVASPDAYAGSAAGDHSGPLRDPRRGARRAA
jgi:MFS family permease